MQKGGPCEKQESTRQVWKIACDERKFGGGGEDTLKKWLIMVQKMWVLVQLDQRSEKCRVNVGDKRKASQWWEKQ